MSVEWHLATGAPAAVAVAALSTGLLNGACLRVRPRRPLPRAIGRGSPIAPAGSTVRRTPARARTIGEG